MFKNKIKIIFVDIDWTILDHNKKDFDYPSIEALKKAQQKGILVYLATARPYHSIKQLGIFDFFTPDGMITSNGSAIFHGDKLIHCLSIPKETVDSVCKEAMKHHCNVELTGPKTRYIVSKRMKYVHKIYDAFYDKIPTQRPYDGKICCTMLFMGPEKYDQYIKPILLPGMNFKRFGDLGADISFSSLLKGTGVEIVLNYLGIKKDNAVSFGDSDLDITMFEATKHSVAVGNAKPEVKQKATHVTKSVSESGVAEVINQILRQQ